ncbi:MAG: hypothetical protein V3R77_04115 [Candidatus Binatia bacterium]
MRRRSIKDALRAEDRTRIAAMTASERVAQALALGARTLDSYCTSNAVDRGQARRELERSRQATRRHSASIEDLIS